MVFLLTSLLVLPLVLARTTPDNRSTSGCVALVDNPNIFLGQSMIYTLPTGLYLVQDLKECIEKCCQEETYCNVGLFLESATNDETNCRLYECRPLESCNLDIKDGFLVFVHTNYLKENATFSSPSSSTNFSINNFSVIGSILDENKNESGVIEEVFTESNVTGSNIKSNMTVTTLSPHHIETNYSVVISSSMILVSKELEFAYQATSTFILVNTEEAEKSRTLYTAGLAATIYNMEMSSNFPSPQNIVDGLYQENIIPSSTVTDNESVIGTLSVIDSVTFSKTILNDKPVMASDALKHSSKQRMLETSFVSLISEDIFSHLVTTETSQILSTSSRTTAELNETNIGLSPTLVISQTPEVRVSTAAATLFFSDLIYTDINNSTFSESANGGVQKPEALTAILICTLTFGCLCTVGVVGVLGVRVYEGYRKRHYSRLDYLINGMYR